MKLHYFPPSPNTRKVQAVIHHLDLRVDLEMVNLVTGEQKKSEYTAPPGWPSDSTNLRRRGTRRGSTELDHPPLPEISPSAFFPFLA